MREVKHINEDEFESVINSSKLVLVDFFATWCPPCKMLGPVLEEVIQEVGEDTDIVKVNVDENEKLSQKFNIMSVPTLILFKDGEMADKTIGFQPKEYQRDRHAGFRNNSAPHAGSIPCGTALRRGGWQAAYRMQSEVRAAAHTFCRWQGKSARR